MTDNDNTEFYKAIDSLKELILTKFGELDKRLSLTNENIDLKIQTINSKDSEQDVKIKNLEDKVEKDKISTWDKIKESAINWIIPFLLMALIFFLSKGTIKI
jgi:hypothetical protein